MNPTSDKPFVIDQTKPARRSRRATGTAKHPYKGITLLKPSGRYKATAWDWRTMRNVPLGHFRLPSQAARAYDEGIRSIRGGEAMVNFETGDEALAAIRSDVLRELISRDHTPENRTPEKYHMLMAELDKDDKYGRKVIPKMFHHWQSSSSLKPVLLQK